LTSRSATGAKPRKLPHRHTGTAGQFAHVDSDAPADRDKDKAACLRPRLGKSTRTKLIISRRVKIRCSSELTTPRSYRSRHTPPAAAHPSDPHSHPH
jgi:hypothetical protein